MKSKSLKGEPIEEWYNDRQVACSLRQMPDACLLLVIPSIMTFLLAGRVSGSHSKPLRVV